MRTTAIQALNDFGQSVWLDNINRSMLRTGKLQEMIKLGLRGMTSNPTIFEKAVISGNDYDQQIQELARAGKTIFEIYDTLTVQDIQDAADTFLPLYQQTKGLDGYVSLEVNPLLAYSTEQTIEEGRRLFQKVNRPNVMFKVPATAAGFQAAEELIAQGININVTLIFSLEQYSDTACAYLRGVKRFLESGAEAHKIRSVASVFVSRIDTVADKLLQTKDSRLSNSLKGQAAVANMNVIYKQFTKFFSAQEFRRLAERGVNLQRVLWASTSTKNPAYSDIKYVTELIAKDSINTLPEATFNAFLDHGRVSPALSAEATEAERIIAQLSSLGIEINTVCQQLLSDGVAAFEQSFRSLLAAIAEKERTLCSKG